jgi:hypothetical protein
MERLKELQLVFDVLSYLKKYLHTEIGQSYFESELPPKNIHLNLAFDSQWGTYTVNFSKIRHNDKDGLLIQTAVTNSSIEPFIESIKLWLTNAHQFSSERFKQMTKGDLYESFTKK